MAIPEWRRNVGARFKPEPAPKPAPYLVSPCDAAVGLVATYRNSNVPSDSIVEKQPHINPEAGNHPVAIVGLKSNNRFANVCLFSSFAGEKFTDKYWNEANVHRRLWHAFYHDDKTEKHNDCEVLRLEGNRRMMKQSWLHIDQFFEIETKYLEVLECNQLRLDKQSIGVVRDRLRKFVSASGELPYPPRAKAQRWDGQLIDIVSPVDIEDNVDFPKIRCYKPWNQEFTWYELGIDEPVVLTWPRDDSAIDLSSVPSSPSPSPAPLPPSAAAAPVASQIVTGRYIPPHRRNPQTYAPR
ncbi:hypothetical protein BAUCODRAFT_444334 [Baudoinia panamericana UAMH 10762]|uniref:Uncharacterized protein n=1 Tax=Baudoinia panamericana (strain UAMH 10762) TaxID=717646 RepID=M2LRW3_BAUPA|nr:uncharacterized protein BAUCODRAFT_444334 [Baudoinia panamericana UAMH 10762]EMC97222.1 hypothetical protein BAUCODRAFT_444334 [Baudoinia panamericana UAMH 10762]